MLATCGEAAWAALATGLTCAATCADLVAAYADATVSAAGHLLAAVAALVIVVYPLLPTMSVLELSGNARAAPGAPLAHRNM